MTWDDALDDFATLLDTLDGRLEAADWAVPVADWTEPPAPTDPPDAATRARARELLERADVARRRLRDALAATRAELQEVPVRRAAAARYRQ